MKTVEAEVDITFGSEMADIVVYKRSTRGIVEYGKEGEPREHQAMANKPTKHINMGDDESQSSTDVEIKGRSSSVSFEGCRQFADALHWETDIGASLTTTTQQLEALELQSRSCRTTSDHVPGDVEPVTGSEVRQTANSQEARSHNVAFPNEGQPNNFGTVVPGVYRSSYPQTEDYPFLQKLGLKTVVTLVHKDFPVGYRAFLRKNDIRHHVFDMTGTKKATIPPELMKNILQLVLDQRNYPLLIHCNHGRHRTGCVVAAVRKFSGWDDTPIIDEYKAYAEPKVRDCDLDYISAFNVREMSNLWAKEDITWFGNTNRIRLTCFSLVAVLVWIVSQGKLTNQRNTLTGQT
jgi:tyrosine-protein phosphatase SIW14